MLSLNSHNVGVAAEAFTAAQFARLGFDVSVQYGANQPEYDLIVARGELLLKVSVKGSQDGSWGLTQSYMGKGKKGNYHGAIDIWLKRHGSKTVFCFVQFVNVVEHDLPKMYLARPEEVAERLRATSGGRGDSILYERHTWTSRSKTAPGETEEIPINWKLTETRIHELMAK
jgi:Holliday junction resolvase-like predicted endonuclease